MSTRSDIVPSLIGSRIVAEKGIRGRRAATKRERSSFLARRRIPAYRASQRGAGALGRLPSLPSSFDLPSLLLALNTAIALTSVLVAVLTGVRFSVDSSRMDLLLCAGFSVAAISIFAFEIAPTLGGSAIGKPETWASLIARIISAVLITGAAFARGQVRKPDRALPTTLGACSLALLVIWSGTRALVQAVGDAGSTNGSELPMTIAFALLALLYLGAMVGFGLRFRRWLEDLDSWLALAATLWLFSSLNFVFRPILPGDQAALAISCACLPASCWLSASGEEFARRSSVVRSRRREPELRARSTMD